MEYQWQVVESCPNARVIICDFTLLHSETGAKFTARKQRRRADIKDRIIINKNCSFFPKLNAELVERFGFLPSSALINRNVFSEIGFFDETIAYQEDVEFFMRAAAHFPFAVVHKRLVYYRRHNQNMTINTDGMEKSLRTLTERMLRFPDNYADGAGQFYLAVLKKLFIEKAVLMSRQKNKPQISD